MNANICGKNIRKRRKELGLAQVSVAAALEVDFQIVMAQSDISEIERQVRGVKDFELKALASILETSLDKLVSD